MIIEGRLISLIVLILSTVALYVGISKARRKMPTLRPIEAFDAIGEAVGRATEMGTAVFDTAGFETTTGDTMAGLDVLSFTARLCAKYDTPLIAAIGHPNTYSLAQDIVRASYLAEGKPEAYRADMVQFTSEIQFAFTASCIGTIQREKPLHFCRVF